MRGIYWRPKVVSRNVLVMIAIMAGLGGFAVETLKVKNKQEYYEEKTRAAKIMAGAMAELKLMRESIQAYPIDAENDPTLSGLVGVASSSITSNLGYLNAKQITINPNWAAVVVHNFRKAGVEKGDVVALGMSGSFPALNLAVLAGCKALELEPIIITSAAGSNWGANVPGFSWLEMEQHLLKTNIFSYKSIAASIGGIKDRGLGMDKDGRATLKSIIEEVAKIRFLGAPDMTTAIQERMDLYSEYAGDRPIKAYVNVGGGTVSVGTRVGKQTFKPGLNRRLPPEATDVDSVMTRFARDGVPVIHLTAVKDLAKRFGLPQSVLKMPPVGHGEIFEKLEYNKWLTGGLLLVLVGSVWLFIRKNLGQRITGTHVQKGDSGQPEPMV